MRLSKKLPKSQLVRTLIGVGLLIGGLLGFLPILGYWMIPVGLLVLSVDFPYVRRKRRQWEVAIWRRLKSFRRGKK